MVRDNRMKNWPWWRACDLGASWRLLSLSLSDLMPRKERIEGLVSVGYAPSLGVRIDLYKLLSQSERSIDLFL